MHVMRSARKNWKFQTGFSRRWIFVLMSLEVQLTGFQYDFSLTHLIVINYNGIYLEYDQFEI